jgi:hypothetical protein
MLQRGFLILLCLLRRQIIYHHQELTTLFFTLDFGGRGRYTEPKFEWNSPAVAPTALGFLNSDRLGTQYKNDMLIGDFINGTIYTLS